MMESTASETASTSTPESTKMNTNQEDSDSLKNGHAQNEPPISQEETHLTESKILLNGSTPKEHTECDNNELGYDVTHENNVNNDPVVSHSEHDISDDPKPPPTNETNKNEKVLEPEESSSENAVPTEEPKSSTIETTPLKQEGTPEPKSPIVETSPLKSEATPESKATLEPEATSESKSPIVETSPSKPEITSEPKSSVEESEPLKPETTPEPTSTVVETLPSKPEVSLEPITSVEEPEVTQEADKNLENLVGISKADVKKPEEPEEPEGPMDILGNGLLMKEVIKEGNGPNTRPVHGKRVALKTEGKLENGTIVDKNDRIEFILGDGDIITAWDISVALMAESEIAELKCDAKYAYGSTGRSPDIPPDATITYTLELLSVENGPDFNCMSIDERMYHGSQKKERGNYLFSRSEYRGAINSYLKAISIIDNDSISFEEPPQKLQQLLEDKIKCYNNLAAAQLKVDSFDAAIKSCEGVLKHHPENVKALFRMGKAYAAKGETKEAIVHMKKALKLEPETKIIHQELSKLTKKLSKETQSERNMYKKMFRTTDTPAQPSVEHTRWKWPVIAGSIAVVLLSVGVAYFRYRQH